MNKKVVLALLGGCVLLCCCAATLGAGFYFFTQRSTPPKDDPIVTLEPTKVTKTVTPTPLKQPTLEPTLTGADFYDYFDDNRNEWELGEITGSYISSNEVIANGKMTVEAQAVAEDGGYTYDTMMEVEFKDFEMSLDGRQMDGVDTADYGLIFRKQDNDNYYVFSINEYYQEFIISAEVAGDYIDLVDDWIYSDAIKIGQVNTMKVKAQGSTLTFYINGEMVHTMVDDNFTEAGGFGYMILLYEIDDTATVEFDNLLVREL